MSFRLHCNTNPSQFIENLFTFMRKFGFHGRLSRLRSHALHSSKMYVYILYIYQHIHIHIHKWYYILFCFQILSTIHPKFKLVFSLIKEKTRARLVMAKIK